MGVLTRDAILGAEDLPRERVEVPEWGGDVFVRVLTAAEYGEITKGADEADPMSAAGRMMVRALVDEAGERLFADDDIPALMAKNAAVWTRLLQVAMTVNKLTDDDIAELEKNSAATQARG